MKNTYETRGLHKSTEEDIFDEGCIPNSGISLFIDTEFSEDTVNDLIKKIGEFLGLDEKESFDTCEKNGCDEIGRLDFHTLENSEGYKASPKEIESWKLGNTKLWIGDYTAYVEKVTRETVSLL